MAKKSLTGKRYFEWLGRERERQEADELLYERIIKKWPVWAQQAYRIASIRSRFEREVVDQVPDESRTSTHIYYRIA